MATYHKAKERVYKTQGIDFLTAYSKDGSMQFF